MKGILFFLALYFTSTPVFSQELSITNQQLQPIEKVLLQSVNSTKALAFTNEKGLLEISGMNQEEIYVFTHPNYLNYTCTFDQLKAQKFHIQLQENTNSLDEIVVSASKFEEKKKDVAQKIQVIRSSELQNMNQTSTADVLANSGNILVQKSQLGGGSPIIRGFETNKVLIVVDGIRMNNAIYRGGHLQNVITLDNAIMERVEIVYGPGSVVYGSDALGGVMYFATKNPILSTNNKPLVKANAYTRYFSAANGYSGHADISVGGKRFGSLTSLTYSNFGDLRQGANREAFVGNFGSRPWYVEHINGMDSMMVNADTNVQVGSGYSQYDLLQKFLFQQNNHLKHTINLQFSNSSKIDRYDRLVQIAAGKPRFGEWYYGPQKRLLTSYSLEETKSTPVYDHLRMIVGYQQIEESRIDRRYQKVDQNNRIERLDILTFNLDLEKKKGKHEIRYGAEAWYNKVNSTAFSKNIQTGIQSPLDTRYASGGASMYSMAVYATHTMEINDQLILNDGLRFSNVGLAAKFTDTTFFNFPFKDAKQNNSALNGNLGIIYMPTTDCRVTALVSTGFRAPNVDDLSKVFESTAGSLVVPNTELKPEYTYNGELGLSNRFGNWLTLGAIGYYTLYRNALTTQDFMFNGQDSILYEGTMSKVIATTNARKAYLYGLELNLQAQVNTHVSMYATYNYTYARIVTDSTAIPLDHIPPAFGKMGVQLKNKKLGADLFVNYSAWKRIVDYNPSGEDNQAYALAEGMPSWYTVNLRVSYQFNKYVGVQVACENILDRNYRVFASNISAPGRNFILTLRGSF